MIENISNKILNNQIELNETNIKEIAQSLLWDSYYDGEQVGIVKILKQAGFDIYSQELGGKFVLGYFTVGDKSVKRKLGKDRIIVVTIPHSRDDERSTSRYILAKMFGEYLVRAKEAQPLYYYCDGKPNEHTQIVDDFVLELMLPTKTFKAKLDALASNHESISSLVTYFNVPMDLIVKKYAKITAPTIEKTTSTQKITAEENVTAEETTI